MATITIEQRITHFCDNLIKKHQEGNVDILDLAFYGASFIKHAEAHIKTLKEYLSEYSTDIATTSEENGGYKGFKFTQQCKKTPSYKNNKEWLSKKAELKEIEDFLKATYDEAFANPESLLKDEKGNYYVTVNDVDEDTGEVKKEFIVYLPTFSSSVYLKTDKLK